MMLHQSDGSHDHGLSSRSWLTLGLCTLVILCCVPGHTAGICPFTEPLLRDLPLTRHDLSTIYALATILAALLTTYGGKKCDQIGMRRVLLEAALAFGATFGILSALPYGRRYFSALGDRTYWFTGLTVGFIGLKFLGHNLIPLAARAIYVQWFPGHKALAVGCSGLITTFVFGFAAKCFDWGIASYGWPRVWGVWCFLSWLILLPIIFFGIHENSPLTLAEISRSSPINDTPASASFFRTVIASWEFWMLSMGVTVQLLIANGISFHIVDIYGELHPQFQHVFNVFIPIGIIGALSGPLLGCLCDAISLKYGLFMLQALQLAILSSFFITHERWSFCVFAMTMGMSWSLYGILLTTSWSRFVAKPYQGRTLGWVYAQTMLGSAAGPWLFSASHLVWDTYRPMMQYLILGIVTMMALTITFVKRETLAPRA
ncbi:MAG: MFS transporter [Puniceicoccales bacterium]|jgi:hypothetical protein|nr:MFS transporter [Puniceicoccales bacterium]